MLSLKFCLRSVRGLPPYAYPSRSSSSTYPTLPLPALYAHNPPSTTSQGLFQTNDWDSPIGTSVHSQPDRRFSAGLLFSPSPPTFGSLFPETHKSEHVTAFLLTVTLCSALGAVFLPSQNVCTNRFCVFQHYLQSCLSLRG